MHLIRYSKKNLLTNRMGNIRTLMRLQLWNYRMVIYSASWFSGSREKALDVALVYSRKKINESQWEEPQVLHKTPNVSEGNSCFFVWPDGELWCFWNAMWWKGWTTNKIRYKISKDNGYTWSDPIWFRRIIGWLIRNKPLMLDNGELISTNRFGSN